MQLNAGSAMGEATTMQGVLPLLVGTGAAIYTDGKWLGNTPQLRDVLGFYDKVYNTDGLGDPQLQLDAKGRDESFAEFADNKIGMLLESDYFWRSVVEPDKGVAPMADRDTRRRLRADPRADRPAPASTGRTTSPCPAAPATCSTRTPSTPSWPGSC